MSKQTLADIVKSKRDASLAKKIEKELAKKKREREELKRIAATKKAKELARIEREKKNSLKVIAQRKEEALKRTTIKKILTECLIQAINGNSQIAANTSCLKYQKDFEQLGFLFFKQIEHTKDIEALRVEKKRLSALRLSQNSEITSSRPTLERYLAINLISVENHHDLRIGLSALQEYIYRKNDLQLDIDYWADLKKLSPSRVREVCPAFSHLSDAMTIDAVEKKLVFANRRYLKQEQWRSENQLLLDEMYSFIYRTTDLLREHEVTEKRIVEVQQLLLDDEQTVVHYMSWEKNPTTKSFSIDYRKLNWFCSRASKTLFNQISEYLIRNAAKSETRFKFKIGEPDEGHKLTIGRNINLLPSCVGVQDLAKKIKTFGFKVANVQDEDDPNQFFIEIKW